MSILVVAPGQNMSPLINSLLKIDSNLDVEIWPEVKDRKRVQFAVSWQHPPNSLNLYPNLKAVTSFGAGVDHILNDKTIPEQIRVTRVVSKELKQHITQYLFTAVLNYRFHFPQYHKQNRNAVWKQFRPVKMDDSCIGILGLGELGRYSGEQFARAGYKISGWAKSEKNIEGIDTYAGIEQMDDFLASANILICLLPLTTETEGILDLELFKKLKKPAYLINVGRGEHLVEEDLIYALDTNLLAGACLDVFKKEPLPQNHPLWQRNNVFITPHIAGLVPPESSAALIVDNYKRLLSGQPLLYEVNRSKGY